MLTDRDIRTGHDDPIARLLLAADAAAGQPPRASGRLADRVLDTWRHRQASRNRKPTWLIGVAAAAAIAVMWLDSRGTGIDQRPSDVHAVARSNAPALMNVDQLRAELRDLQMRADVIELSIRATRDSQPQPHLRQPESLSVLASLAARQEAAAAMLFHEAEIMEKFSTTAAAADAYDTIVRNFPESRMAAPARSRLVELRTH